MMTARLDGEARREESGSRFREAVPVWRREQERGEGDAQGRVASEEGDRDADEADRRALESVMSSRNCQPRTSIAPARPANRPAIAIARK